MSVLALDTSVAVPLLVRSHAAHDAVRAALGRRALGTYAAVGAAVELVGG